MAWFILHVKRSTTSVYIAETGPDVTAEDKDYIGYFDGGEEGPAKIAAGPFDSREAAINDDLAWVEGR